MFEVHFCASNEAEHGLYNYKSFGSLSQVIEGARVKSMQLLELKYREWLVLFKQDGEIVATRTIKEAKII